MKNKKSRGLLVLAVIWACIALLSSPLTSMNTTAEQKKSITYVALGDSLTAGIGSSEKNYLRLHAFVPKLTSHLRQQYEVYVENHGIPGLTSAQLVTYLEQGPSVHQKLKEADLITITIGGNDLLQILRGAELTEEQITQTIQQFGLQIEATLKQVRQHNQQASVYLMGLYNPYVQGHPFHQIGHFAIASFNQQLLAKAKKFADVHVVPVDKAFDNQANELTHMPNNDVHPNDKGYQVIFEAFKQKIDQLKF